MKTSTAERNRQVVEKVKATVLYQAYEQAFQEVTGLSLTLQPMHVMEPPSPGNAFCQMLSNNEVCRECQAVNAQLMRAATEGVETRQCAMGLAESAVPVKFEKETIALLRTGQVRHAEPGKSDLQALGQELMALGYRDHRVRRLAEAYTKVTVMDADTYEEAVTMLAIFSLHVTTLISQLILSHSSQEAPLVTKAKAYVREHLEDRITLGEVAALTGVSSFYFCKVFKQQTGMTFTVYVNRQRIECAKRALLEPRASVIEIAYDVGYQSLSQFNRCFRKFVDQSPSEYRKHVGVGEPVKDFELAA
jgi:AraC-like DNA-binding protein